jgi:hypothetical protein
LHVAHAEPLAPHAVVDSDASAVQVPEPSVPQPDEQHDPDSQRPLVHAVPFVVFDKVPLHTPALEHVSFDVQTLPSSQAAPVAGVDWHTRSSVQVSVVHGLPSSQVAKSPQMTQRPSTQSAVWHWSFAVHVPRIGFFVLQTPAPQ